MIRQILQKPLKEFFLLLLILILGLGVYSLLEQRIKPPRLRKDTLPKTLQPRKAPLTRQKEIYLEERKDKVLADLQLELLGTILSQPEPFARIRDRQSGYEGDYKIGDRIKDSQLIEIRRAEVELLRADGRKEILTLLSRASVEEKKVIAPEKIISEYVNINNILKEVSLAPEVSRGQIEGLRLTQIKPGSLIKGLGFKEGDVLKKINGSTLKSPQELFHIYQEIKEKYAQGDIEEVKVDLIRAGQPEKMVFSIK